MLRMKGGLTENNIQDHKTPISSLTMWQTQGQLEGSLWSLPRSQMPSPEKHLPRLSSSVLAELSTQKEEEEEEEEK